MSIERTTIIIPPEPSNMEQVMNHENDDDVIQMDDADPTNRQNDRSAPSGDYEVEEEEEEEEPTSFHFEESNIET